jgi:hypothetical protein
MVVFIVFFISGLILGTVLESWHIKKVQELERDLDK